MRLFFIYWEVEWVCLRTNLVIFEEFTIFAITLQGVCKREFNKIE